MAWYPDLSACDYFREAGASSLTAVGWLERDRDFAKGDTNVQVYERLAELLHDPFQPMLLMGCQECDLCQFPGKHLGSDNLFVPGNGTIYVCPELILHYIDAHWYSPPEEFRQAILVCPPTRSMEYKRLLLKNGGGVLLKKRD